MRINNKFLFLLVTIITITTLTVGYWFFIEGNSQEENKLFTYLPIIKNEEFQNKFSSGEEFFVYIGRPDCGDSRKFQEEFKNNFVEFKEDGTVANIKYDLDNVEEKKFYYFDISEIISDKSSEEQRLQYKDLYGFFFTPTLIHYKDIDGDGVSEAYQIAEWDAIYGFGSTDYMKWFYDTRLVKTNDEVIHDGGTDKE